MAMLEGEQLVAVIDVSAGRLFPVTVQIITDPTTGAEQEADCTTAIGPADATHKLLFSTNGAAHPAGLLAWKSRVRIHVSCGQLELVSQEIGSK